LFLEKSPLQLYDPIIPFVYRINAYQFGAAAPVENLAIPFHRKFSAKASDREKVCLRNIFHSGHPCPFRLNLFSGHPHQLCAGDGLFLHPSNSAQSLH